MALLRFVVLRILGGLALLLAVSALIFLMIDVLPGDVAGRILGRNPDPERLQILRAALGLDLPLAERYLRWLMGVLRGDFGQSLISGQPVSEMMARRVWNSVLLGLLSLVIYVPLAVLPAIVQAVNQDGPLDHAISAFSLAILSIPDFLLATLLLIAFVMLVPVAPARSVIDADSSWPETLRALSLPATTIALVMGTYAMRYLRDSLIEVLQTDHIRMARLNGIPPRLLIWRHAIPNALVPFLNVTALNLTYLFGGVVVIEQVFSFPGFGALMVGALLQLDVPLIQATVLVAAAVYILGNLAADLASMALNPRLRHVG
jgi:peptide/nickel transport system permease protein